MWLVIGHFGWALASDLSEQNSERAFISVVNKVEKCHLNPQLCILSRLSSWANLLPTITAETMLVSVSL